MKYKASSLIGESPNKHLGYLDGLRALTALYVVIHHESGQVFGNKTRLLNILEAPFKLGHYAVDVFIVISGFCLMMPLLRNDMNFKGGVILFYKKRIRRIIPPYFFAGLFSLLLISTIIGDKTGTHWDVSIPVSFKDVLYHIFLIHDFFKDTSSKINHVFWSIAVEFKIYFIFPLIIYLWRRKGVLFTLIVFSAIGMILWFLLLNTNLDDSRSGLNPHYVILFLFGALGAEAAFTDKYDNIRNYLNSTYIKIFLLLIAVIVVIINGRHRIWVADDIVVGILSSILLVGLSVNYFPKINAFLSYKPLVFVGTFAYSIYLIHAPVLQVLSQYVLLPLRFSRTMGTLFLLTFGTGIIIGIAYLFYLIAERPFVSFKPKKNIKEDIIIHNEEVQNTNL